ncbi:MAG: rhomboid family intramembrane serine protease [Clostridia bacterium]|nr:rhomboid family intramembrane serine protease [Clostridia bacterium]
MKIKLKKLSYNAPVTLTFVLICFAVFLTDLIFGHGVRDTLFCVYGSPLSDPLTYIRFFTHVFGHADADHLLGNMLYILLLGPMLEEKHGKGAMILLMAAAAFITGVFSALLFPNVRLLGASGIVFAMILMSSFTEFRKDTIPLTFILVAVLYIGREVLSMFTAGGNVAYGAHVLGGAVGGVLGYLLNVKEQKTHSVF